MRVAVYLPPEHPHVGEDENGNRPTEPVAIAFRLGRIEEGVHNAPIGHEPVPIDQFVDGLLEQAKAEYPDCEVRLERLVDNGDGTARWIPAHEFDPEQHAPQGPGNVKSTELHVVAGQEV